MSDRPAYRELPTLPDGTHHAWGLYGDDDGLGGLNLLTPERVRAAAGLVRTGARYPLNLAVTEPDPPLFGRQPVRHDVFRVFEYLVDDRLDNFFPQGSSQWDALCHFRHSAGFYNGRDDGSLELGLGSIEAAGRAGIAGRGVLLDVARWLENSGDPLDPRSSFAVTADVLRAVADSEGVALLPGDIWCIRTGWVAWFRSLDHVERQEFAATSVDPLALSMPGLSRDESFAELVWDQGVTAIATDTAAGEALPGPAESSDMCMHARVMTALGIMIGELFDFDALAQACADDGVYDFFFTAAPLVIPRGIGSPSNAMAIR
jgi:kynurenine formamidase